MRRRIVKPKAFDSQSAAALGAGGTEKRNTKQGGTDRLNRIWKLYHSYRAEILRPRGRHSNTVAEVNRWDEFYMAPSATTINENGKHWQYAVRGVWSRGLRPYWHLRARG